ncbi:2-dehydropantoate 2-reductase [Oceanisphaera litoralis]|uniref:ketopantoate reductase family protein n=1 Tax=Oceanisphaera litoralis TaxID=225144 RepID=UPI00195C3C96|nr:2-dehydropantoate 2-reductase [Oceanisphaera litoralis]MBM7455392.1 2-dehydropantoate 2-reductase [Oceanisphaera litoralis]
MKFLMIGAGGIGGYYGARLQQAGHQVVLVARGEHLAAMQQQGLRVEHEAFCFQQPVQALSLDGVMQRQAADDFDLIILALKSQATEGVMAQLSGWLGGGRVPVLSLQNGVDNEPHISAVVGEARTLGGLAVRIGGHLIAPGLVQAEGPGQVIMGAWPQRRPEQAAWLAQLQQCFEGAGVPTQVVGDIRRELWRKLIINNGVNPLSALSGLDTRSLTHHPLLGRSVYQMMAETAAVAEADGVSLGQADVDAMFELMRQFDAIKTSMLVDREKGRELELDAISGAGPSNWAWRCRPPAWLTACWRAEHQQAR